MFGLTRGATAAHIARAALESIACLMAGVLDAMQAGILGVPVLRCGVAGTTALGAAYLAGLTAGFWKIPEEVSSHGHEGARFEPRMPASQAASLRARWMEAVGRAKNWHQPACRIWWAL